MTDNYEPDRAVVDDPTTEGNEAFLEEEVVMEDTQPLEESEIPVIEEAPVEEAPVEEDSAVEEIVKKVSPWFNPQVRQAVYGVSMALVPLLVALGIATEQQWLIVAGVIDSIFGLLMATLHTNTPRADQAA